jgi:hypothetical protein
MYQKWVIRSLTVTRGANVGTQATGEKEAMSKQVLAAVGLTAALAGIVGGVTYAQTQPVTHEAPMVVVPAAQVVPSPAASATATPTAVPTVTATQPAPVVTVAPAPAPKVVAPAPVQSTQAPALAPVKQTVKRYTVSAQSTPQPVDTGIPAPTVAPTDPNYSIPRPPLPPGVPAPNVTGAPPAPATK